MAKKLKKSLFIGLGGTGARALLYAKRKLIKVHGEIPPMIRFLVLDTDPKMKQLRGEQGEMLTFGKREFLHIAVPNGLKYIEAKEHISNFFPEKNKKNAGAINKGAGQIRSLGRLALFFNQQEVRDRLSNIVDDLRTYRPSADDPYEIHGGDIQVSTVFSTAGGTGSGTFLDIPYLLRDIGIDHTDTMMAYTMMPNIFLQFEGTKNVEANSYGAFKELDFLLDGHLLKDSIDYGGEHAVSMNMSPYDNIITIDNITENKIGQNDISALNEILGTGLYLSTGVIGDAGDSVWDNLRKFVNDALNVKGKSSNYCSMGISELFYDGEKLKSIFSNKLTKAMIDKLRMPATEVQISEDVEAKLSEWKIREAQPHDEVIDAIFDISQGSGIRPSEPDGYKKGTSQSAQLNAQKYLEIIKENLKAADGNTDALIAEKRGLVDTYLNDQLNKSGGIFYCKEFITLVKGNLSAYKEEMKTEKATYLEQQTSYEKEAKLMIDDILEEEEGFNPFGKKGRIQEAVEDYYAKVVSMATAIKEITRRDSALRFYNALLESMDFKLQDIANIEKHLADIAVQVQQTTTALTDRRGGNTSYVVDLHDLFLTEVEIQESDYNMVDFFNYIGENKVSSWNSINSKQVMDLFIGYAGTANKAKNFSEMDVDTAFRKLPQEMQVKLLETLEAKSDPLWTYSKEELVHQPSYIYLVGVNDDRNTALKDEDPTNKMPLFEIALGDRPSMAVTNDPQRIYFYKFAAAVPAYTLSRMDRFRRKYLSESARYDYHIDRSWKKQMDEIGYDLFPSKDEASNLKVWAEANAFGLVSRKSLRGPYMVQMEEGTDPLNDDKVNLDTTDRREAYNEFLKKHVEVTTKLLDTEYKRLGDEQVLNKLREYHEKFKENVKEYTNMTMTTLKQNESTYKLINAELRVIAELVAKYESSIM